MDFASAFEKYISPVQGWCQKEELEALFNLSGLCLRGSIEIGGFCGRSTAAICLGRENNPNSAAGTHVVVDHFVCSDPQAPKDVKAASQANTGRLPLRRTRLVLHPVASEKAWPLLKNLRAGLLFIDGNHTFDAVTTDMNLYAPLVTPGGWLILHDCYGKYEAEVCRAADKWFTEHPHEFEETAKVKSMRVLKRT